MHANATIRDVPPARGGSLEVRSFLCNCGILWRYHPTNGQALSETSPLDAAPALTPSLFSLEVDVGLDALNPDAPPVSNFGRPILLLPLGRQRPADGRAQPQAQQVAPALRLPVVRERRAAVQDHVVVQQLDVPCTASISIK